MRPFFTFLLFLSSYPLLAQRSLQIIPAEIISTAISGDEKLLACTTADSVYIFNTDNLALVKKWAHRKETPVIKGFHPSNNNILLLQEQRISTSLYSGNMGAYGLSIRDVLENYQQYDRKYNELPEDSVSMWDVSKMEIVNTSSGSFYAQFGREPNSMIAIGNKVYSYDSDGKTRYSAARCEIQSLLGEFRLKSIVNKTCKKLILSPSMASFAVSWRDGYIKDSLFFSAGIYDFKTHQPIYEWTRLSEPLSDICYSADGKYLALSENKPLKEAGSIRIIEISTGKIKYEIKELAGARNLQFSIDGTQLYYLDQDGRNWFAYDMQAERISQRIWPKLISLDELLFTHFISDKMILAGMISSFEIGQVAGKNKTFLVDRIDLQDLSLFTKTTDKSQRVILDSTNYTMLTNDVVINNNRPEINFTSDRRFFTRVDNKTQLQVWNSTSRKKLIQTGFENSIRACPDKTGKNILVVEANSQKNYNEFQMHLVSLSNGLQNSTSQLETSKTVMDGNHYQLKLVPDPFVPLTWYGLDGSSAVWQIKGLDLQMKKIVTLEKHAVIGIQIAADGSMYMVAKNQHESFDVYRREKQGKLTTLLTNSIKSSLQLVGDSLWMWNYSYSGDSTIEVWADGSKTRTITIPGPVQKVEAIENNGEVMVHYESKGKNSVIIFKQGKTISSFNTEIISTRLFLLSADEILSENEGFTSLVRNGTMRVPWTVRTPQLLDITNFDVSSNGNFLLLDNRVIDLKEVQQWNIDKYSPACLLQDSGKLSWIEIYDEGSYGSKTGGFTLYKFIQGRKDTIKSKTWVSEPKTGDNFYFKHDQLRTSPDKKWAISFTRQGMLNADYVKAPPMLWDLNKMEGRVIPVKEKSYSLEFSADSKKVICTALQPGKKDDMNFLYEMQVYQLAPFKLIRTRKDLDQKKLADPADGEQFVLEYNSIGWMEPKGDSLQIKKSFYSRLDIKNFLYSPSNQKLIAGSTSGNLMLWNVNGSSSPIKTIAAHNSPIMSMALRGNKVYSLAENGEIAITSLEEDSLKLIVRTLVKDEELRIAMSTPEGYYRVDPDLMNDLHFVKNGEVFPLSSFELQGNRPDKVYAALGLADTGFISALRESWKNRIRKAGFDPEKPIEDKNRPLVNWDRQPLPLFTSEPVLPLQFEVSSSFALHDIFIRINGVPLHSKKGIKVATGLKNILVKEKIPLITGNNSISVVARDENGMESLEQSFDIQYEGKDKIRPRLIYLGIGISDYADTSMNLRYAAKDVKDLSERLHYYFDSVEVHILTDKMATRENILALKKELQRSGIEDMVMVSFSGHGMIEADKGFYFAPHDMDFSKPSMQGLSMEMIDDLLDDIPARKRLLLLDACHSGEQWEGLEVNSKLPDGVTAIKPRGGVTTSAGESINGNKLLGYQLMKELFSDFSRGNGAFMISAAASNEFAFEGEEWNNGVFTKSLLDALRELRSKGNYGTQNNLPVKVRELRKVIYEKVSALTNGRQNPTSRQENGWWNWSF